MLLVSYHLLKSGVTLCSSLTLTAWLVGRLEQATFWLPPLTAITAPRAHTTAFSCEKLTVLCTNDVLFVSHAFANGSQIWRSLLARACKAPYGILERHVTSVLVKLALFFCVPINHCVLGMVSIVSAVYILIPNTTHCTFFFRNRTNPDISAKCLSKLHLYCTYV